MFVNPYIFSAAGQKGLVVAPLPAAAWNTLAMSPDGMHIVVGSTSAASYAYVSHDGGASWSLIRPGTNNWVDSFISADGQRIVLVSSSDSSFFVSMDGGESLMAVSSGSAYNLVACAAKDSLDTVFLAPSYGYLRKAVNYPGPDMPANFICNALAPIEAYASQWVALTCDPDASYVYATTTGTDDTSKSGRVSTNQGTTMSYLLGLHRTDAACGGTRAVFAAASQTPKMVISGGNPSAISIAGYPNPIACDVTTTGKGIALCTESGSVKLSTDYGATWQTVFADSVGSKVRAIALSDDMSTLAIADYNGYVRILKM